MRTSTPAQFIDDNTERILSELEASARPLDQENDLKPTGGAKRPSFRYSTPFLRFAIAAAFAACNDARWTNEFHEIGRFHARDMHSLYPGVTHFVVAPESVMANRSAVLAFSRRVCSEGEQLCFVFFWTDESKAATGFPITTGETDAMVASYESNRSSRTDGLPCYNFGSAIERCAAR